MVDYRIKVLNFFFEQQSLFLTFSCTPSRFITFIVSSIITIIIIVSLIHDDALLNIELGTYKLATCLLVGTLVLTVTRSLVPEEHVVFVPAQVMERIVEHTHYYPPNWRRREHTHEVYSEFAQLFQPKFVIFLVELFSVLIVPFILLISVPKSAGIELVWFFFSLLLTIVLR